jgi:hypothetical protein
MKSVYDIGGMPPSYFEGLEEYVVKRLGKKAGAFFTTKENVAGCNEMLQIDNAEFLKEGIITELTN